MVKSRSKPLTEDSNFLKIAMGKSKRFNLVWEKSSRKKPDIWFQRLRRRITRTIGYTVVLFLGLKYLARLFFGDSILDAVTDQLETVIYGALKDRVFNLIY